jgi:hypothetical protein
MVDLGVDRGGLRLPVPKDLADLRQRRPGLQHLAGCGMPQPVGTHPGQPGPVTGRAHHPRDRAPVQLLPRRGHPQEQRPALASRATAKIGHDRLADIDRQRQRILAAALAVNQQQPGAPVEVVKRDRGDLTGP